MTQQENSSENNISALVKKLLQPTITRLRYLFVHYKAILFIAPLFLSYRFMDIMVLSTMMDYLTEATEVQSQRTCLIITNLQDVLSSLFFVVLSQISEAYADCCIMITFCAAASIEGLLLLWTSTSPSAFGAVYAAIVFLAIGKGGLKLLENFLEYQLEEKIKRKKESQQEDESKKNKEDSILPDINKKFLFPLVEFFPTIIFVSIFQIVKFEDLFRFAALFMGASHLLFIVGSLWYSREELLVEYDLKKIHRICKAAFGRRRSDYPTSQDCYYWKGNVRTDLCYEQGKEVRLKPRVPRLFRWLDKAAIVKAEEHQVSHETQEKKKKLCIVKEVREVKSLVLLIYLGLIICPYSLLLASGNTFFVTQASVLRPVKTDLFILFVLKAGGWAMSEVTCSLISFAFRYMKKSRGVNFMFKRKTATIIRIGFGIACAVICSFIAWQIEFRRLSSKINTTTALIPQFVLLGITEGLVDGGLARLFKDHVAKSLSSFEDSFSEFVDGAGKLLIIPIVLIFRDWITETMDTSHLDRYYLMLAILNVVLLLPFGYYYLTYAYKEVFPEDEKVSTEQRLDDAHGPNSEDSHQEILPLYHNKCNV